MFEDVVKKLPQYDDVQIETTYVFGTPEVLAQNWDAEILVSRGMTHDVLKELFPEKHVIRIQLSSFDIFDALVQCRHEHAKKIALCIHNIEINCLKDLEQTCGASITIYDVQNEMTTEEAVSKALADGADIFVGAGTMCGICDRMGLKRIHIHTKHDAVEIAMLEALNTARTINLERARADIIRIMLNHRGRCPCYQRAGKDCEHQQSGIQSVPADDGRRSNRTAGRTTGVYSRMERFS